MGGHTGTSVEYLTARLQQAGRTDLLNLIASGKISTFAAAIEAGFLQRRPVVGGGSPNASKRRQHEFRALSRSSPPDNDLATCGLTFGELQELWLGPTHNGSLFSGEAELQDAWIRGRDVVMRIWGSHGKRPRAWWYFEAPKLNLQWPGPGCEQSYLFDHGILSEAERAELECSWRYAFDHGQTESIPDSLCQPWRTERRRRRRQTTAAPEEAAAK